MLIWYFCTYNFSLSYNLPLYCQKTVEIRLRKMLGKNQDERRILTSLSDAKNLLHLVPKTITETLQYLIPTSHCISSLTYPSLLIRRKHEI